MPALINHPTPSAAPPGAAAPRIPFPHHRRQGSQDWATPWFNSSYYHALYKNRDEEEARFCMDNVIRLLQLGYQSTVLDLGCGRGRHAVYLGTSGADVTGIDIAHENIAYARRYEHDRLRFEVGDMREDYGSQRFTEILNLFTSFGYFAGHEENRKVLRRAVQALRPGGRIVIDFLNAAKVMHTLVPYEIKHEGTTRFEIARRLEDGFIVKDLYVADGATCRHFQERVQALVLADFVAYFEQVGLDMLYVFGDYALRPFEAATSDRLILIAQKPEVLF